jgi:hypothetical protein
MGIFNFFKKNKKTKNIESEDNKQDGKKSILPKNYIDFKDLSINEKNETIGENYHFNNFIHKEENIYYLNNQIFNGKAMLKLEWNDAVIEYEFNEGKVSGTFHYPSKYRDGEFYRYMEKEFKNGQLILETIYIIGGGPLNMQKKYLNGEVIEIQDYKKNKLKRVRKYEDGKRISDLKYNEKGELINEVEEVEETPKDFWEIVEIQGFIYKDDEMIADGIGYTLFSHIWLEDVDSYDIEYDDPEDIIVNGETFDIDYEEHEISWENQEVVDGPFYNLDEAYKAFGSY